MLKRRKLAQVFRHSDFVIPSSLEHSSFVIFHFG